MSLEVIQLVVNVIVPFLLLAITMLYKRLTRIEDKQYEMKGAIVTKDELQKTEDRITHNMDERIRTLSSKLDVLINQQNILILERESRK